MEDRPDYDYTDHTTYRIYEPTEASTVSVYDKNQKAAATLTVRAMEDGSLSIQMEKNVDKSFSVEIYGGKLTDVDGARLEQKDGFVRLTECSDGILCK